MKHFYNNYITEVYCDVCMFVCLKLYTIIQISKSFCLFIKVSLITEPIEFSILERLHIGSKMTIIIPIHDLQRLSRSQNKDTLKKKITDFFLRKHIKKISYLFLTSIFVVGQRIFFKGRDGILDCLLKYSPNFYKYIFLFVGLIILETF